VVRRYCKHLRVKRATIAKMQFRSSRICVHWHRHLVFQTCQHYALNSKARESLKIGRDAFSTSHHCHNCRRCRHHQDSQAWSRGYRQSVLSFTRRGIANLAHGSGSLKAARMVSFVSIVIYVLQGNTRLAESRLSLLARPSCQLLRRQVKSYQNLKIAPAT
jgi:hypothetical protein